MERKFSMDYGKQYRNSSKELKQLPNNSEISLLDNISKISENRISKIYLHAHVHSSMLTIAKRKKQPKGHQWWTWCGIYTQWNTIQYQQGRTSCDLLQHWRKLRTLCWVKQTNYRKDKYVGFHLYEAFMETKNRMVITRSGQKKRV